MVFVELLQVPLFRSLPLNLVEVQSGLIFGDAQLLLGRLLRRGLLLRALDLFLSLYLYHHLDESFFE